MIHTASVALVDRDGEDCDHCDVEGHVIAVQIYSRVDGERRMDDGCFWCAAPLLEMLDQRGAEGNIQVEISEYQLTHIVKEMEAA